MRARSAPREAEEKLEELATTDALTGLKNRRKFDIEIDLEWRRAARNKTPVAVLMIDADHFKAYNDTFGHQAGDQVLVGIAICISDAVRRAGDCSGALRRRGIRGAAAGPVGGGSVHGRRNHPPEGRAMVGRPSVTTVSVGVASMTPRPQRTGLSHRSGRQGALRGQGQRP